MITLTFCLCLSTCPGLFGSGEQAGGGAHVPARGADAQINPAMAEWLVDLARHHGHVTASDDPRRSTLHVLALMKMASTIDPDCADAWLWQFDLLDRLGRGDQARAALSRYVALAPGDESAALQLLSLTLAAQQTAETRGAHLTARLKEPDLPRSLRSDIHRRLAEFYRERDDRAESLRHIEQALRYMLLNLPARQLAYEMFGETEPLLQRVEMALQLITMNPSQVNVVWELGKLLDAHGLHPGAREWYQYAMDVHRRASDQPVPPDHWLDLAVSHLASGEFPQSLRALQHVLDADPRFVRARVLRAYVARRAAQVDDAQRESLSALAQADIDQLSQDYVSRYDKVLQDRDANAATEMAWFFAHTQPDAQRALKLAEVAISSLDTGSAAHRAYGFALVLNQRAADAIAELRPLADVDPMSAYGLAQALLAAGDRAAAADALRRGMALQHGGPAYDLMEALLKDLGASPPDPPRHEKVEQTLARFDRRVLSFHKTPADTLRLTAEFLDSSVACASPCRVRLRLENINPTDSFSVTLGEGLMVRPRVVLSARLLGGDERIYRHYTEVLLNQRPVLAPGEAIERIVSVDVGELRDELFRTATTTLDLEITAILDPVRLHGQYHPGLGSVYAPPARATRPGLPTDPASLQAIVRDAASADATTRRATAFKLGALVAIRDKTIGPSPLATAITAAGIEDALRKLGADADWSVRAATAEAVRWGKPPVHATAERLSGLVHDESPVVRMLAIRLFEKLQAAEFAPVLKSIAGSDKSAPVRLLAASYLVSSLDTAAEAADRAGVQTQPAPRPN